MFRNFWWFCFHKFNSFQCKIHSFYGNIPDECNETIQFLFHRDILVFIFILSVPIMFKYNCGNIIFLSRRISEQIPIVSAFSFMKNV